MSNIKNWFAYCVISLLVAAPVSASNHEALIEGARTEGKLVLYTSLAVDQAQKLNFVVDDIGSGDDYSKNYEQFRNIFGAPKQSGGRP